MTRANIADGSRHTGFQTLALTGGSGAGKGVVSEILTACHIPVLDTDHVSRIVCEKGQPCLSAYVKEFGDDILNPDGTLDRRALAARVFGEPDEAKRKTKLDTLNKIAHTYILDYCRAWLSVQRENGFPAACIDAPQLFESGFDSESDYIIGVTADKELRIQRILVRDGISRNAAEARIAAQHDDVFFRTHCDIVLENNGTKEDLLPQVTEILRARGLLS